MRAEQSTGPAVVRRCAVLGKPIVHSLSPVLHAAAYAQLGLPWRYDAIELAEDGLAPFVDGLSEQWRGLSLTMPLKRAVLALASEVVEPAGLLNSANTLILEEDRRIAANTDVDGFVAAFTEAGITKLGDVAVIGSGATAASALAAASILGATAAVIVTRSAAGARSLAAIGAGMGVTVTFAEYGGERGIDESTLPGSTDAVISTIPATAQPRLAARVAEAAPVLFDVVYSPRRTPFLITAEDRGRTTIEGFSLLLHQAARQVELMTGVASAPLEAMRAAGLHAIGHT